MCGKRRNVWILKVKLQNIGYELNYSDLIEGNKMRGKR